MAARKPFVMPVGPVKPTWEEEWGKVDTWARQVEEELVPGRGVCLLLLSSLVGDRSQGARCNASGSTRHKT